MIRSGERKAGISTGTLRLTFTVTAAVSDGTLSNTKTFTWTVTAAAGTITLDLAPQDTYMGLNSVNYATTTLLNTYTWPANEVANTIEMKFALAQIPATATIMASRGLRSSSAMRFAA